MKPLIVPYTREWHSQFKTIRKILFSVLEDKCLAIEYVGSTSIPELAAKPTIYIDISI